MLTGSLPQRSNLATWTEQVKLTDADDGSLADLTLLDEITVSIREPGNTTTALLTAKLTTATVTLISIGVFQFTFTAAQMATLCPDTYEVGCLVTFNVASGGETEQIILGTMPVVRGL